MSILKWLKNLIFFIIKEILSFFIKLTLAVVIIVSLVTFYLTQNQIERTMVKERTYLEMDLSKKVPERGNPTLFSLEGDGVNFYKLLALVERAKKDRRIEGIIIKTDSVSLNRAQIDELGRKLGEFRETGKKVYAFSKGFSNESYSLAINADEIIMPPSAGTWTDIKGYFVELTYLKNLSDKLGIKYNVINVGDYKSYGENFVREEMSPEFKENIMRIMDKIYYKFIGDVSKARNLNIEELDTKVLNGDFVLANAFKMKEENLIDKLQYYTEFLKEKRIENRATFYQYSKSSSEISGGEKKIALIYGDGEILFSGIGKTAGSVITPDVIISEIEAAERDNSISGIVIRIDSPGGSALASEIISAKIKSVKKPVYVSMGGRAASGGYYISAAADKIFAERGTVTGSIGVVSLIPDLSQVAARVGVNIEIVEKGKLSGIYSVFDDLTTQEHERIYQSSLNVYNEFKERVSTGRNISVDDVEALAGGRVWLGEEALEKGLVDQIGGLEDTVRTLAKDINISNYQILEIRKGNPMDRLFANYSYLERIHSFFNKVMNLELDSREITEENELLINPVVYFPYDI